MTTLKLSKKPVDAPVAKKAPARRADSAKRDRSQPFVKPEKQNQKMDGRSSKLQPEASFSRPHGNEGQKNEGARQRNHRHDGSLHDTSPIFKGRGDGVRGSEHAPNSQTHAKERNANKQEKLKAFARELRADATNTEQAMWHLLRDKRFFDFKFRRQHAVGEYILDFYCADTKLAIELDGGQHAGRAQHDQNRADYLKTQGIKTLRFWNNEFLQNTEGALETIAGALFAGKHLEPFTKQEKPLTRQEKPLSPSPLPLKMGEGLNTTRNYADREGAYRNPPRRGGKVRDGFVASEFDKTRAARETTHKIAAAKLPQNEDTNPRLSKRMAELGLCSRREADEWITNGWVKVDGVIIDTLGTRIKPDVEILISGYAKEHQSESVTILLHKPVGFVSGQAEDGYEPAIVLVHPDNEWLDDPELNAHTQKEFQRGFLRNLAPAGRLDIDSTGLLVLTQDGRIARHLIGEDSSVEKEYLVRVEGTLSEDGLTKLNNGLSLDGVKLKPAKVSWQNEDQLRFVLREGKKRQIRRMCEMVGLTVIGLKRVRIGSVNLGKLPVGQWRYLRANERF